MLVLVDGVESIFFFLLNGLYYLLHVLLFEFLLLLFMGVDSSYKEAISIVLNVLHIGSWRLFIGLVLLKHLEVADLHL